MQRRSSPTLALALALLVSGALQAQTVLSYHGNCGGHYDPVPNAVAQYPGVMLTQTTDTATFRTQIAMGGWDVVTFDEYGNNITAADLDALVTHLGTGGGVIFSYWNSAGDGMTPSHPLFTVECPLTFNGGFGSPIPFQAWDPAHPVLTSPNLLTFPLAAPFDTCGTDGQRVEPTGGSVAIAGYTAMPAASQASLVINPSQRMIFNGQVPGLFTSLDADDLIANELGFLLGCRGSCVVPHTVPLATVGCPGFRSSDGTVMVDTSMCMVDQETPSCSAGGDDSFASFVAPFDGTAIADTCGMGTTFDTLLVAYIGAGGCGALAEVACNDDTCGTRSEVTFPIFAGTRYYLLVDGSAGATGIAELRVQLTEVATDYVPAPGLPVNTITAAVPRPTAIDTVQLAAAGNGGGQVAYLSCFDQYYGFEPAVGGTWEVFDGIGAPVSSSTMVGLDGRGLAYNPLTGNLEVITSNAMTGGGITDGAFILGLDIAALFDSMNTQIAGAVPGLIGNNTAPALDYDRNVLYSREGGDTVNIVNAATGMLTGTIILDSVAAGSPAFVANGIAYTGIFAHELIVGGPNAAHIFDLGGAFVASVAYPAPVVPGDYSGSFVNDLYWSWDTTTLQWHGYDLFDTNFTVPCSSAMPMVDLVLVAGAHTIDTDTGDVDGVPDPAFDGTAFNYDNVDIQVGAIVTVSGSQGLIIHATGDITVDGDIEASGMPGTNGTGCNSVGVPGGPGGPGGGAGGDGAPDPGFTTLMGGNGGGPGGGSGGFGDNAAGGGGGFAMPGNDAGPSPTSGIPGTGGPAYVFLLPTVFGGSGGGGGSPDDDGPTGTPDPGDDGGAGAGGGGGAVLLNAAGILTVGGNINANGGNGGNGNCSSGGGGGGSGGYIALLDVTGAPAITGSLNVNGGTGGTSAGGGGDGSPGRIFMDMTPCGFSCTITGPMMPPTSSRVTVQVDAATAALTYDATFEFSLDAGATYSLCTAALGTMGAPPVVPNPALGLVPGMMTAFVWDSAADGVPYPATGVLVRATVDDGVGMTACTTAPFDIGCECGDCNLLGDGVTITDALVAAQIAAGISPPAPPTPEQQLCCDVTGDLLITVLDALGMAQISAGIPFTSVCP